MHTWFHVQLDQKILKGLYSRQPCVSGMVGFVLTRFVVVFIIFVDFAGFFQGYVLIFKSAFGGGVKSFLPYALHYNPRFVYFYPLFEVQKRFFKGLLYG